MIKELHYQLNRDFGLKTKLHFDKTEVTHFYYWDEKKIVLTDNHDMSLRAGLAHEFAHALHQYEYGEPSYHDHGKIFYNCLINVIDKTYTHIRRYPWHLEYTRIQNWAKKDGFYLTNE